MDGGALGATPSSRNALALAAPRRPLPVEHRSGATFQERRDAPAAVQGEAMLLQNHEAQHSLERAMALVHSGALPFSPHLAALGVCHLQVRRSHVLGDTLAQLQLHINDLRKPLKITFLGGDRGDIREEAVDEGALPASLRRSGPRRHEIY